jgi:hypothetical protein
VPLHPVNQSRLDCAAARRLIDLYLVDELDERDAMVLADHVRECPACSVELGGATRLIGLLGSLPAPTASPDLDERIVMAAIADRRQRTQHVAPWWAGLPAQIARGTMRTTGTLVATMVVVALMGGAFAFAAAGFIAQTATDLAGRGTVAPVTTPTLAPTSNPAAPTATPDEGSSQPAALTVSPEPTEAPTDKPTVDPTANQEPAPEPTPEPTIEATATPEPSIAATPEPTPAPTATPKPTPTATPAPTPEPSPSPTEKPRRTPPPSPTPSPTSSAEPSESPTLP